jgi:hypothetical protein
MTPIVQKIIEHLNHREARTATVAEIQAEIDADTRVIDALLPALSDDERAEVDAELSRRMPLTAPVGQTHKATHYKREGDKLVEISPDENPHSSAPAVPPPTQPPLSGTRATGG